MPRLGNNGGLMGLRRVPSSVSASGVWDSDEQSLAKRAQIWPVSGGVETRYLRFGNFASTALNNITLDLAEIRFYNGDTVLTGITTTTSFVWTQGSAANLTDGDLSNRSFRTIWSSYQSTATISFDFGSTKLISDTQIYIFYENNFGPRFPDSFDVLTSTDGTTYTFYASLSKGSSTLESGDVYKTAKLSLR